MTSSFDITEQEIRNAKKQVDFDIRAFSIEYLVQKFKKGDIYLPDYQRDLIWSPEKQATFIESIILGLPISLIFVADLKNEVSKWEMVDGVQAIKTLEAFVNGTLKLGKMPLLKTLENNYFAYLSTARRRKFLDTQLKLIVFSENSDRNTRLLMFERFNQLG
jgi:hypothetical protein